MARFGFFRELDQFSNLEILKDPSVAQDIKMINKLSEFF